MSGGATTEEALHREIREELSVGLVGVYDSIVKDVNNTIQHHYIIVDYCAQIGCGVPRAGSDAAAARRVTRDPLEDDRFREAVSKDFSPNTAIL